MNIGYKHNLKIAGINFSDKEIAREYENCTFEKCSFQNVDLSNTKFIECTFDNCDLSMAKTNNVLFRDIQFNSCKVVGVIFGDCDKLLMAMDFKECQMNLVSFFQLSLKNTMFKDCKLREADFTETDLSHSTFDNCDLAGAIFQNTNIISANFRTSFNYSIDPEHNQIHKAKFSLTGLPGLLEKYKLIIE